MKRDFFSNHIGASSELTMIADIKPGLVPVRESISYASRLRRHLKMLSALRRSGLETDRGGLYVGPIDSLRTLQYVKWTLIDNDTKMLLAVNFDRPLEPYIRRIVDVAGPLLDTILCHCVGFEGENGEEGHFSDLGYHRFAEFPEKNQVEVELFAAASPNFSVDDADYFTELDAEIRRGKVRDAAIPYQKVYKKLTPDQLELRSVGQQLTKPHEKLRRSANDDPAAVLHQALSIIRTMHESSHLFPEFDDAGSETRDDFMYYRLTESLVQGFWDGIRRTLTPLFNAIGQQPPDRDEDLWIAIRSLLDNANELIGQLPIDPERKQFLLAMAGLLSDFREALDWFAKRPRPRVREPNLDPLPPESELQVPISFAPEHITHASLFLLRVDNASEAANFLHCINDRLFPAAPQTGKVYWTLSITDHGLEALEIPEEIRKAFPAPFREGMAARAGLLGDIDSNHPNEWEWPKSLAGYTIDPTSIDLIIQVQKSVDMGSCDPNFDDNDPTDSNHPLYETYQTLNSLAEANGVTLLGLEAMQRRPTDGGSPAGHLGFADGISQPGFDGDDDYEVMPDRPGEEPEKASTKRGDILLGREGSLDFPLNEPNKTYHHGEESRYERLKPPFLDGTFQVIRKISLDVKAFQGIQNNVDDGASNKPSAEEIQEKMFGRKKDGTPLVGPQEPGANNFNYSQDPEGTGCPLQSHIRRANPREKDTPRILRQGFSYGSFDHSKEEDRGLMFIAYNANIAEQFELIQRWMSGGNVTGIPSLHGDPLLAPVRPGSNRVFRYTDGTQVVKVELPDQPLAALRWGLYAFVPSKEGLHKLISMVGTDAVLVSEQAKFGAEVIEKRINSVPNDQKPDAWKILLEDRDHYRRDEREAVWAWIRETHNGVLDTGDDEYYGVLVGSVEGVNQVMLNSDESFSVREYWNRMKDSIGPQNLGFDENPIPISDPDPYTDAVKPGDYRIDADLINPFIAEYSLDEVFDDALKIADEIIDEIPIERQPVRKPTIGETPNSIPATSIKTLGRRIDLERFIDDVAAKLSVKWFGLPEGTEFLKIGGQENDEIPHCPQDLLNASFYVFGPAPAQNVKDKATKGLTPKIRLNLEEYSANVAAAPPYTLLEKLKNAQKDDPKHWSDQKIGEVLAGVTFGFVGPTPGSFLSVVYDWIDDERFWRVQQDLLSIAPNFTPELVESKLRGWVLQGMCHSPIPDMLYRRTVKDVRIGDQDVAKNRMVTFSIASAVADDANAKALLFGGDYWEKKKPTHACPGQKMGLYTIYGALTALMKRGRLKAEGPLTLRLDEEVTPTS